MTRLFYKGNGSIAAWNNENALEWGAALAYYTAFSIAPLLIIVLKSRVWLERMRLPHLSLFH